MMASFELAWPETANGLNRASQETGSMAATNCKLAAAGLSCTFVQKNRRTTCEESRQQLLMSRKQQQSLK
jgi:hypothetical protein